jgi:DNA repair ATPase RecN
LTKLLNFTTSKSNDRYEKKYQAFKECGNILTTFIDKKKEMIDTGSYYLKIKELYSILELYEHFDQVFDYIKNRIIAIKEIAEKSDQFNNLLEALNQKIKANQDRFNNLLNKYDKVLKEFESFNIVFKEIEEIDKIIKQKKLII